MLCSLCVCHGVAVRSNQNLICDNLLPGRDLLLQTRLVNHVSRYAPPHTHAHTRTHSPYTHAHTHTHKLTLTVNIIWIFNKIYPDVTGA